MGESLGGGQELGGQLGELLEVVVLGRLVLGEEVLVLG